MVCHWACSTAIDGAGERETVLGPVLEDRRGHKLGEGTWTIGEELRCVLGATGPRGAAEFRSVTGVNDGVIIFITLTPARGNKWFPPPAASDPEDDVVSSHNVPSMVYLFTLTGVCEEDAIAALVCRL